MVNCNADAGDGNYWIQTPLPEMKELHLELRIPKSEYFGILPFIFNLNDEHFESENLAYFDPIDLNPRSIVKLDLIGGSDNRKIGLSVQSLYVSSPI